MSNHVLDQLSEKSQSTTARHTQQNWKQHSISKGFVNGFRNNSSGKTTVATSNSEFNEFNEAEANYVYRSFKKKVSISKPQRRTITAKISEPFNRAAEVSPRTQTKLETNSHVGTYIHTGYEQGHLKDLDPTMENPNLVSQSNVL